MPALCALGWSAAFHPLGWRFAFGDYPVPSGTPWTYQLESGFIPALTVLSLASLLAGAWHHVNCHETRCWRIGRHKVDGTPWCNRHQDKGRLTQGTDMAALAGRLDRIISLLEQERADRRSRRGLMR